VLFAKMLAAALIVTLLGLGVAFFFFTRPVVDDGSLTKQQQEDAKQYNTIYAGLALMVGVCSGLYAFNQYKTSAPTVALPAPTTSLLRSAEEPVV